MNSSAEKFEPTFEAVDVKFTETMTVELKDGRQMTVPLDKYPFLKRASKDQKENFEIFGEGRSIEWPDLGEFLSVEGIILGYPAIDKKLDPIVDDS